MHTHKHTYTHIHTYTHTNAHTHIHTHTHSYTHTYTYTYTHIHTHTHLSLSSVREGTKVSTNHCSRGDEYGQGYAENGREPGRYGVQGVSRAYYL